MTSHPYLLTIPAVFLTLIVCSLSYLGDGLRDALDPRGLR
jgi:ABC-type dipeptide/oligopeptide/nickel transport system permease subunit